MYPKYVVPPRVSTLTVSSVTGLKMTKPPAIGVSADAMTLPLVTPSALAYSVPMVGTVVMTKWSASSPSGSVASSLMAMSSKVVMVISLNGAVRTGA